jgi:hypothetical protein
MLFSHTSPVPSPSASAWSGLAMVGQLSMLSEIPSPSESICRVKLIPEVVAPLLTCTGDASAGEEALS